MQTEKQSAKAQLEYPAQPPKELLSSATQVHRMGTLHFAFKYSPELQNLNCKFSVFVPKGISSAFAAEVARFCSECTNVQMTGLQDIGTEFTYLNKLSTLNKGQMVKCWMETTDNRDYLRNIKAELMASNKLIGYRSSQDEIRFVLFTHNQQNGLGNQFQLSHISEINATQILEGSEVFYAIFYKRTQKSKEKRVPAQ